MTTIHHPGNWCAAAKVIAIGIIATTLGYVIDCEIISGGCYTMGFLCLPNAFLMYRFGE